MWVVIGKSNVADAVIVFERLLADAGWKASELTADIALQVFGVFAAEQFATGRFPDADGLLYQYGVYSFTGQDMFHLDLTRQFEIVDDAGEHEGFVQFHCTLHYPPDPELTALGRHDQWWFHDGDSESLPAWLAALEARPEWSLLRARRPSSVVIGSEDI
jgi:hypothetical protein